MSTCWNSELVRATDARICYHMSIGSSREFMWRKAKAALLSVEKDIRLLSSGRLVNMPRLRETSAQQELEAIIRGEKQVVPPEMEQALGSPPERDFNQHPYLRRMEYRGGGFAILMAFELRRRQHDMRQFMFKSEIIQEAQRFCDISMLSTDGWMRSRSCGWASHRSLLSHRLLIAGRGMTQGREEFSLSADGQIFLDAMLRKWPLDESQTVNSSRMPPDASQNNVDGKIADTQQQLGTRPRKTWAKDLLSTSRGDTVRSIQAAATPQLAIQRPPLKRPATEALHADSDTCCEISSDEEHTPIPASSLLQAGGCAQKTCCLLVDDKERLRDAEPRGLLDRISSALQGSSVHAARQRLPLGDYVWVTDSASGSLDDSTVLNCIIERKRISDLVGRSAVGAHAKQLRRLNCCTLARPYILLEGEPSHANYFPVYDEILSGDSSVDSERYVIRSGEDIDDLCARLLVHQSKVGVLMTKDAEGTARLLSHVSKCLHWTIPTCSSAHEPSSSSNCFGNFEVQAAEHADAQRDLTATLRSAAVPSCAVQSILDRFQCARDVLDAVSKCASPSHRLHYFDSCQGCAEHRQRICGALGIPVPPDCKRLALSDRRVNVRVTSDMKRRIFSSSMPAHVVVHEDQELFISYGNACCAEIVVCAELRDGEQVTPLSSDKIILVIVPGTRLLQSALESSAKLGAGANSVQIAIDAAQTIATALLGHAAVAFDGARMVMVEGLRSAVLDEARRRDSTCQSYQHLPNLLTLMEMIVLVLDLNFGWRVRVHDVKQALTTAQFAQAVIRVAYEEMSLPCGMMNNAIPSQLSDNMHIRS